MIAGVDACCTGLLNMFAGQVVNMSMPESVDGGCLLISVTTSTTWNDGTSYVMYVGSLYVAQLH